jgi:acetyl esterase/lipase
VEREELQYIPPVPVTDPAEFPHDDAVPEGCVVVDGLRDTFGPAVDCRIAVYAERDGVPLHVHVYEPTVPPFFAAFEEAGKQLRPLIVYVPGSAFHKQQMFLSANLCIRMAARGYVVAAVEYRPSEVAPFPAQMQDCKTAIRYLKKNASEYRLDSERIALWGASSGGHTILMAGFTGDDEPDTDLYREYSASVNCLVDWFAPTDFAKMNCAPSAQDHSAPDSPEGFEIGRLNVLEHPEIAERTVPMNYLRADKATPPLLIMHGGRDMLVPFQQSCMLFQKMRELGKDVTFIKLDHANHGFLGFDCDEALDMVGEFIKKHI